MSQIKAADLRTFQRRLLAWYEAHGRHDLPWRKTADAYPIWISEVMLQQTQVATVLDRFYHPFLKTFPTIQHLANAPREQVMKAWEGLGYYRRAGFLHDAAKIVVEGGLAPYALLTPAASGSRNSATQDDVAALMSLPGIGRNTAHAILAFAHRQPVAILEANVKRIVARIFAWATPSDAQLWAGAEQLLNTKEPFDHNQAMMDLGSILCTPRAPQCPACPANRICRGQEHAESYPAPKVKKKVPTRAVDIVVREDAQGRLYLEQRRDALLGGLYGFPQISVIASVAKQSRAPRPEAWIAASASPPRNDELGNVVHIYSHFRLEGRVLYAREPRKGSGSDWYSREEIRALPLSKLDHKVLTLVDARHSAAAKVKKARSGRK